MIDEVIIISIIASIVSVFTITFKNVKQSHCWNKDSCCDCVTRGDRNSNSNSNIIT